MSTSRARTSSTSVSSVTLITVGDITSRAVAPCLTTRSYSLTSPTTAPSRSVTGTPLMRWELSSLARSAVGVSGSAATTGVVMISFTFTRAPPTGDD